ncbi:MAG: hypothetical protein ACQERD_10700 [Campylobacterota bacterium]
MEENRPCESAVFGLEQYSHLISSESNPDDIKEYVIKQDSKIIYLMKHYVLEELKSSITELEIISCVFAKDVFINKEFSLKNCCFEGKFYINTIILIKIDVQDTKF